MTEHSDTAEDLIARADTLSYGPEERRLLSEAVRLAEEAGQERLAYDARMRLTSSASVGGDTETMLANFGWCVGMHDSDPVRFPLQAGGNDLLYQYKWMAESLSANPAFPLAQIDALLDDMAARYRAAGAGEAAVLQSRFFTALITGRLEEATRLRELRDAVTPDDYSHCAACLRNEDTLYLRTMGRTEEALAVYDEIVDGQMQCAVEPERSEAEALLTLLRADRLEDARAWHLRSYRAARMDESNMGIIAEHLVFCAITGNEARGLAMLERHLPGLADDPLDAATRFAAFLAVGVLLDAVARAGHPDTIVRGADDPALTNLLGAHNGPWTAADLAAVAWARAEELATAFDARNGTDAHAERVRAARALADEHYAVPLNSDSFQARTAPLAPATDPDTATDWMNRARALVAAGDESGALRAIDRGLALPDDGTAVRLYAFVAQLLLQRGDDDVAGAEEAIRLRTALLRADGQHDRAELEERLGGLLFGIAGEADRDTLEAEIAAARTRGASAEILVDLMTALGEAHLRLNAGPEALELLEEAVALAATMDDVHDAGQVASVYRVHALLQCDDYEAASELLDTLLADDSLNLALRMPMLRLRAQISGSLGETERSLQAADTLVALTTQLGYRPGVVDAARLSAQLLSEADRDAEAAVRMQFALQQAQLAGADEAITPLRFLLGRYQHFAGQSDAAIETLDDVYRTEAVAEATPGSLAETLYWLGEAATAGDQPSLAYSAWMRGAELADEAGDPLLGGQLRISLGTLLLNVGDDDAVEVLEAALDRARTADSLQHRVSAQQRLGQAKAQAGRRDALADFDEVLEIARGEEAEWLIADVLDSRARALGSFGETDEAVQQALTAADGYAAAGDVGAAAMAELFAGRILARAERSGDAFPLYRQALERLTPGTGPHTGVSLELGELLENAGLHDEAATVRRSVRD